MLEVPGEEAEVAGSKSPVRESLDGGEVNSQGPGGTATVQPWRGELPGTRRAEGGVGEEWTSEKERMGEGERGKSRGRG